MCETETAAVWPEDLACEPGQEPRGCRYIEGDVGDPTQPWRYCQADMLPGHRPGSLAKPPYCAEHIRLITTPLTESGRRSREKFFERIAKGEEYDGPAAYNGWWGCTPVDIALKGFLIGEEKGFKHD